MGLKPGQTNNPDGRPPGSINKLAKDLRLEITMFLETSWPEVVKAWEGLKDPKDKLNFYRDLLQYSIPKKQNIAMDIDLSNLNDEQLDRIVNELLKREL